MVYETIRRGKRGQNPHRRGAALLIPGRELDG
jgi:hypothetical protein